MSHCTNINHPQIQKWAERFKTTPETIGAMVSLWQQQNNDLEEFPSNLWVENQINYFNNTKYTKQGVEELFDSNPELANQVYEALGFDSNLPIVANKEIEFLLHKEKLKINLQDITLEEEGEIDLNLKNKWNTFAIKAQGKKLGYIQVLAKDDNTVKIGLSALYEGKEDVKQSIISKILNLISNLFKTKKVEDSGKRININAGKGIGKIAYELLAVKLKQDYQKDLISDTTRSEYAENLWKSFERQGKASVIGKTDTQYRWDYYYKFNVDNQITPQQKQQAISLYSQYLEQNPNGTVEQFKNWVEEFNKNKYLQLASDIVNPAIEELDNFLLNFLKAFNVKTKQFEELKSRLGVDALGATDVLNKLIWYVKNRNEETLPEESAHMLVALMGENHPDIKELLNNITNWSEYENIKKEYLPIYKDEEKVKIEAVGKLIAKSLIKNYKISGLNQNKLQKLLQNILEYIESILESFDLSNVFFYNQSIADHIAINVLSGNKDYIYKIKNLNPNLNAEKEINNNPNAKKIINRFSSNNVKMTGSLAIAGTENIRRPEGQGIHDIDFKVKSFDTFNKEVLSKIPENAVPAHYGWHKKTYSTYAYLIPLDGYKIEVLERKDDFSNGWITNYKLFNEKGEEVEITQSNVMGVDFFVYKEDSNQKDFDFTSDFIPASLVYEGKISLDGKSNPYFFSRDKDQEDYVLRNPQSFIPFEKHIYYQLDNNSLSDFISQKSQERLNAIQEIFNQNPELSEIGDVFSYASYLDTIFPDSKVEEMDDNLYISVLNQLEQENKIEKDCNGGGKLKAKEGISTLFEKGGKWEIITDFKNAPTHKSGGKDISIQGKKVEVEKNELRIENDFGDVAVIPSKYRVEIQDAIKSNCHSCIDGIVESLPKMKDYAGDGTVFPFFGRYKRFKNSLPDNLKNTPESDYAMRYYWKHGNKPKSFDEAINREQPMFTMEDDGFYHAPSVEPNTLRFLKPKNHPTLQYELDWYNSDNPDAVDFRSKYDLDTNGKFYRYVPKK